MFAGKLCMSTAQDTSKMLQIWIFVRVTCKELQQDYAQASCIQSLWSSLYDMGDIHSAAGASMFLVQLSVPPQAPVKEQLTDLEANWLMICLETQQLAIQGTSRPTSS